ncbi:MAG: TonB-dependent receptor plug domain-containing protein [Spirochaetes bacterium]|nr:TonB-dependent receptor plug domain-containing protein [Spirochaetota bacterium]
MKFIKLFSLCIIIFISSPNYNLHAQTSGSDISPNDLTDSSSNIEEKDSDTADFTVSPEEESRIEENTKNPEEDTDDIVKTDSKEVELRPVVIKREKTSSWKKKDIQSISRQTLSAEDMKEVPASFGDSVSALTSLPGINRMGAGIFGPLIIRGASVMSNNYFIDDIPVHNPLHFGGLHSVINTNLIDEIDVYSSAFPAEFGSATAAVINMSTIDEVNETGGFLDLSLLGITSLIKMPIKKDTAGNLIFSGSNNQQAENAGYAVASGRYGYLGLAIKAAELITGDDIPVTPVYYDYQFKMKYNISKVHSATVLFFGYRDYLKVLSNEDFMEDGDDPLYLNAEEKYDITAHNLGLYFDSRFSSILQNRVLFYASYTDVHYYYNFPAEGAASWAKDLDMHSKPSIFGLKDKASYRWLDRHAELKASAEYTFYYFTASGKTILNQGYTDVFDIGDEDSMHVYNLDEKISNHTFGGYLENKFLFGEFEATPGIRSDYLVRSGYGTFDPRLHTSYRFSTDTTISCAGGHYSYFPQTNGFIFETNADIAAIGEELKPEKAWHSSAGVEQEIGLFTLKAEGFYNYFYDQPEAYPHYKSDGSYLQGLSSGKAKAYGFEIMLRKDSRENQNGLFGWMCYTYTRSKYKSGLPTTEYYDGIDQGYIGDEYGDKWITSSDEQRHNFKLVSGYRLNKHILSGRFQYYSSLPYTPITGSYEDPDSPGRYIPTTGDRNSANYPAYYSLDLRYTHRSQYSWGQVSWYIEVINILMKKQVTEEEWNWTEAYSEGSNPTEGEGESFSFLPNFGVEIKF